LGDWNYYLLITVKKKHTYHVSSSLLEKVQPHDVEQIDQISRTL
jgi:hypothetical protein